MKVCETEGRWEGGVGSRNSTRKWMDAGHEASGQSSQVPWTRIPIWSEKGHFPGCERKMEEERGERRKMEAKRRRKKEKGWGGEKKKEEGRGGGEGGRRKLRGCRTSQSVRAVLR